MFEFLKPKPRPPEEKKPLLLFAEMDLHRTGGCRRDLHRRAVVFDYERQLNISFEEAIALYYGSPDRFFKWSFQVGSVSLERIAKTYQVYGDGLLLGEVEYSRYNDSSVRLLDALTYIGKIERLRCEVKDAEYFYLTEDEYHELVASDPYNRGFPKWAADAKPKIKLFVYFEDGVVDLSEYNTEVGSLDPDDYMEE